MFHENFENQSHSSPSRNKKQSKELLAVSVVGPFLEGKLQEAGVRDIAEKIIGGQELQKGDAERLVDVSLPLLGKLLELQKLGSRPQLLQLSESERREQIREEERNPKVKLRPLFLLPLAALLDQGDFESAYQQAKELLSQEALLSSIREKEASLFITLDRWHGRFDFETLSALVRRLANEFPEGSELLGPSAKELKELAEAHRKNPEDDMALRDFLRDTVLPFLRTSGISTIFGGTSVRVHKLCAELGFQSAVSFDLNAYRLRSAGTSTSPFVEQLFLLKKELPQNGVAWMPLFRSVLDRMIPGASDANQPLGEEVLKAIALARMFLPDYKSIQAPLAIVGHKAADIAFRYGANDLGFVAVDRKTAEELELPLFHEVLELFSTTPIQLSLNEK